MLQRAAPDALLAAHRLRRAPYSKGQLKKSKQDLLRAAAAELFDSIESDAAAAADAVAPAAHAIASSSSAAADALSPNTAAEARATATTGADAKAAAEAAAAAEKEAARARAKAKRMAAVEAKREREAAAAKRADAATGAVATDEPEVVHRGTLKARAALLKTWKASVYALRGDGTFVRERGDAAATRDTLFSKSEVQRVEIRAAAQSTGAPVLLTFHRDSPLASFAFRAASTADAESWRAALDAAGWANVDAFAETLAGAEVGANGNAGVEAESSAGVQVGAEAQAAEETEAAAAKEEAAEEAATNDVADTAAIAAEESEAGAVAAEQAAVEQAAAEAEVEAAATAAVADAAAAAAVAEEAAKEVANSVATEQAAAEHAAADAAAATAAEEAAAALAAQTALASAAASAAATKARVAAAERAVPAAAANAAAAPAARRAAPRRPSPRAASPATSAAARRSGRATPPPAAARAPWKLSPQAEAVKARRLARAAAAAAAGDAAALEWAPTRSRLWDADADAGRADALRTATVLIEDELLRYTATISASPFGDRTDSVVPSRPPFESATVEAAAVARGEWRVVAPKPVALRREARYDGERVSGAAQPPGSVVLVADAVVDRDELDPARLPCLMLRLANGAGWYVLFFSSSFFCFMIECSFFFLFFSFIYSGYRPRCAPSLRRGGRSACWSWCTRPRARRRHRRRRPFRARARRRALRPPLRRRRGEAASARGCKRDRAARSAPRVADWTSLDARPRMRALRIPMRRRRRRAPRRAHGDAHFRATGAVAS